MTQARQYRRLLLKSLQGNLPISGGQLRRIKLLDGHQTLAQAAVLRLVNRPHPPLADVADDVIPLL